MRLSEEEKREMLEDAQDPLRRDDFRQAAASLRKLTLEEYVSWITQVHSVFPLRPPRNFVEYKNILI